MGKASSGSPEPLHRRDSPRHLFPPRPLSVGPSKPTGNPLPVRANLNTFAFRLRTPPKP